MGRFSPDFLAAVRGVRNPAVVPVATVYWPTGTRYYASEPFLYFEQRIAEAGLDSVTTAVSERQSDLSSQPFRLSLEDKDGAITRLLEGRLDPSRARVTARLALATLAEASWFTFFDGVLEDWSTQSGVAVLSCRTDDLALEGVVPKAPLLPGSVPGLISASRGIYAPIIYGIHDDQSLEGKGAIRCIPIDATTSSTAGKVWLVGLGALKAVPRVYKNGTLKTLTTHYTVGTKLWGGATYTVVTMVEASVVGDEITCDVEGLTDAGDGSGALITGAASQVKHFLVNFGYGDWRTGAWLPDAGAPIDVASVATADAFTGKFGGEGSLYVGGSTEQQRVLDVFNGWLRSWPLIRARWSADGKLGLRVLDHGSGGYLSVPWVQPERDELEPMRYETVAGQLVSRVSLSYLPGQRAGKLWQTLDLQDLRLWGRVKVTEQLALEYSAARFQ